MFTVKFESLNQIIHSDKNPEPVKEYVTSVYETPHYVVIKNDHRISIEFNTADGYEVFVISPSKFDFDHCFIENQAGKTIAHYDTSQLIPLPEPEIVPPKGPAINTAA